MTNTKPKNIIKPKIKIAAVGGKACNTLLRLQETLKNTPNVECVAIGKASNTFNQISLAQKIELRTEKSISEVDELSQEKIIHNVIDEKNNEIVESLSDSDILFVLGNLSNKMNIKQVEIILSLVKGKNIPAIFFGSHPFSFEGEAQVNSSILAQEKISKIVDATILVDNNKLIVKGFNAKEALTTVDSIIAKYVTALIDIVNNFGVINVDFNDFKTTIENAGDAFFSSAIGSEDNVSQLLTDLFDRNYLATKFEGMKKIVYVIKAGTDLAMDTINRIGQAIHEKAAKDSRIIFGVVNDPEIKEKVQITLMAGQAGGV